MSAHPRVAFSISPELGERVEAVIEKLRSDSIPKAHVGELVEVVLEMTEVGLEYYYLRPLEVAGVGMMLRSSAKLGIAAAGKSTPMIVRTVVGGMSNDQLLKIANFLDEILIRSEA